MEEVGAEPGEVKGVGEEQQRLHQDLLKGLGLRVWCLVLSGAQCVVG